MDEMLLKFGVKLFISFDHVAYNKDIKENTMLLQGLPLKQRRHTDRPSFTLFA